VIQVWEDSLRQRLGPVHQVGSTSVTIEASGSTSRRHESVLGDLVTDAMRAGTGADVALINAGALRLESNIVPGPITNYELEALLPFADQTRVISFPISGAGLRRLLEHGVAEGILGSGGFLQVSGLSFTFDPAKPSGSRIAGEIRRESGQVLQAGDTLMLAFGAYSACTGGDGYSVPEAAKACARQSEAPRAVDLLTRYITDSLKGNIPAPSKSRIIRAGAGNTNPG
jgi:2',3'-cyclic-nucleotide 2'-phosphodiesterase (5'-nucleotidase family)